MRNFCYIILLIFIGFKVYAQDNYTWKIKLKLGNELRIPILKHIDDEPPQHFSSGQLMTMDSNVDIDESLNGFPIHYALEFKLGRTWSFEFQHSIHYDHVGFEEEINFEPNYYSVSPGLDQFFSDYKFSFFKYFPIKRGQSFNINLGYSLNQLGDYYYILNHYLITSLSHGYTAFNIEANYQYKFLSLGIGTYVIDDIDSQFYINNVKEGFGSYIFYFNVDFDILKF